MPRDLEHLLLQSTRGVTSRCRLLFYRCLGMQMGTSNRIEGGGRVRRCRQISIGSFNAFTQGCWLWPQNDDFRGVRIQIGNGNYFNRNVMLDACGLIEIGDNNMVGPDVYVTDSNHAFGVGKLPKDGAMSIGKVKIGSGCWIGARAVILKDVELGDWCVVGAGAVVTRSVPSGTVVAGIPARPICQRSDAAPDRA